MYLIELAKMVLAYISVYYDLRLLVFTYIEMKC